MMLDMLLAAVIAADDRGLHAEIRRDGSALVLAATNRTARNLCFHLPSTDSPFREESGHPGPGFDAWMRGIDIDNPPSGVQVIWADGAPHEYPVTGGLTFEATIENGTVTRSTSTLELVVYDCRTLLSRPWGGTKPLFTRHIQVPK